MSGGNGRGDEDGDGEGGELSMIAASALSRYCSSSISDGVFEVVIFLLMLSALWGSACLAVATTRCLVVGVFVVVIGVFCC